MKLTVHEISTRTLHATWIRLTLPLDAEDKEDHEPLGSLVDADDNLVLELNLVTGTANLLPSETVEVYLKVRDAGTYQLLGPAGKELACIEEDYVPGCVPSSYGDYVIMKIDPSGDVYTEGGRRWVPNAKTVVEDFFPLPEGF